MEILSKMGVSGGGRNRRSRDLCALNSQDLLLQFEHLTKMTAVLELPTVILSKKLAKKV